MNNIVLDDSWVFLQGSEQKVNAHNVDGAVISSPESTRTA
jgi:hypothetical protein